jgi:uncharacterized protein (TIGR03435 family)
LILMRAITTSTLCFCLSAGAFGQSFEVASIKPHPPALDAPVFKNPDVNPIQISGNRIALQMIGLKGLVMAAYDVKEYQVSAGPAWASAIDSMYDIEAKTSGETAPGMAQVRLMLQALLADRCHLKLRRESKELPVYSLVVAKGGPKLKEAPETQPPAPGMRRGSLDQLVALLSLMLDRPVIDKTGLTGIYDYSNGLTLLDMGAQDSADAVSRAIIAIQDQLGLRLESAKAPLEMLVIESAEKPTQN